MAKKKTAEPGKRTLVATIYHQSFGSDPDLDDAIEYHVYQDVDSKRLFMGIEEEGRLRIVKDYGLTCPLLRTLTSDAAADWET